MSQQPPRITVPHSPPTQEATSDLNPRPSTSSDVTLTGSPTTANEKTVNSRAMFSKTGPTTTSDTIIDVHEMDHITEFPNKWAKLRFGLREPAAEFIGTMILVMFGTGVNCQVALSGSTAVAASPKGDYLSASFGWATGVAMGVWVAGGISGGHINPAITLSQAVFRGFSWKKVPGYILAQILGACTGAGLVYANYHRAIDLFEGGPGVRTVPGTASLFATFSLPYMSNIQSFFEEFLGTAVLLIVILAVTDKRNGPPPAGLIPLVLFIALLGISTCFGMQTSFAINPARDLGPRLMCWMAGYGKEVWNYRGQYWLYAPIIGPILGAFAGTAIYDAFLFTGSESIFNRPNAATRRKHMHAPAAAEGTIIPSGMDAV